jgi:two-component system phosphate regulon sensor histidine kinase PhoR
MVFNARAIALLLAVSVALITTFFLSLVESVSNGALLIASSLSFGSTYILTTFIIEFLFFKEINNIYDALTKINDKDFLSVKDKTSKTVNPLKGINDEIFTYAALKQREIDELKRMETFRREFLADISHELKTPIFAAQGFVHTLLDGAVEDKKVRKKFLKKAAKSLDGLDMLVHDLLTLSHMESGEIKMHYETFDIIELTREVFDQFEERAEKKGVELHFDEVEQQPIYVEADYQRIYQVQLNLVSNAIKYTKRGGKMIVAFEAKKNDVSIMIKDTGKGIPPEDINRIFERFYRVEKSRSKEKGGTGLGLAIVKHIIEAHNSQVNVTSTVGKGSIFSYKLKRGSESDKGKRIPEIDEED